MCPGGNAAFEVNEPFYGMQGKITFEKDATFTGNRNEGEEVGSGPGGAISVHVQGSIYFMGKLTMTDNYADVSLGGGVRFLCFYLVAAPYVPVSTAVSVQHTGDDPL